jgi:hypothetical protein
MRNTNTNTNRRTYAIYNPNYSAKACQRAANPELRRTLTAMAKGAYFFVNEEERTQVHSYARSLKGRWSTEVTSSGDYRVTRLS